MEQFFLEHNVVHIYHDILYDLLLANRNLFMMMIMMMMMMMPCYINVRLKAAVKPA